MDAKTVDILLNTLTQSLRIATDNQNKIKALESVLKDEQAALYEHYSQALEKLKKQQDFGNLAVAIEALRKGLLQE